IKAEHWFPSSEAFQKIAKQQKVYVFAKKSKLENFLQAYKNLGFKPIAESGNTILLSNKI
ncbi:MAG: hypothetical protein M3R00_05345, partial [Pseudomonadota bacterium]|nr:hypothetical protein [Pseudomonadota bacterium]